MNQMHIDKSRYGLCLIFGADSTESQAFFLNITQMNHSFDTDIAIAHGVNEAIFIENVRFWIAKNKANGKHFHDGRYWTYNSIKAYAQLFPYWSVSQVRRIIESLQSKGILLVGNYNENTYDRTQWYALNEQIHLSNSANGSAENDKSLIGTDINTDIKPYRASRKRAVLPCPTDVPETVWEDFLEIRKAKGSPLTTTALEGIAREAEKAGMSLSEALSECCARGWQGFKASWMQKTQNPSSPISLESFSERDERMARDRVRAFTGEDNDSFSAQSYGRIDT